MVRTGAATRTSPGSSGLRRTVNPRKVAAVGKAVEAWLDSLSPEKRTGVDHLREIVHAAAPELVESIEWSAPSFADGGQDPVTLGLAREGGWRVVVHRGASVRDAADFTSDGPDTVAKWPPKDRGVATFAEMLSLEAKSVALPDTIRRGVEKNRQA